MLTAYIFCLAVGGGFLALSFFGDFLEGDVDIDADVDLDADMDALAHGSGIAQIFSLRAAINALFGFGAAGSLLHLVWGGGQPILTAAIAGGMGVASGALISSVFGYLKRTESGTLRGGAVVRRPDRRGVAGNRARQPGQRNRAQGRSPRSYPRAGGGHLPRRRVAHRRKSGRGRRDEGRDRLGDPRRTQAS